MAHLPLYLLSAAVIFVGLALALVDPLLVATLALPGAIAIQRLGGASLNISVCDVLTVAATAAAVPLLRKDMRVTRRLLWVDVLYQAVLLLVVVAHPNEKSIFEWWHRFFLAGGCIAVGAVLGRARRANEPVIAFLVLVSGLSIAAIAWTLSHGLSPAYPLGYQKNTVGAMTASAVLLVGMRPSWLRLSRSQLFTIMMLCAGGLLASQSRGAMLALAAGFVVVAVRQGRLSRSGIVALAVVTPLVVFAVISLRNETDKHAQFSSLTYRADYSALAYREWHLAPTFGQGLRYFERPGALLQTDAHNVVASTLAEGGVIGLLALALLLAGTLRELWRLPAEVGALALAFVAERFVHGLFDIYWVAGPATLPWIIVGVVCGTADADAADRVPAVPADAPVPSNRARFS